jgi:hypothetical protein
LLEGDHHEDGEYLRPHYWANMAIQELLSRL